MDLGHGPSPLTASGSRKPSLCRKTFQPPGPAQRCDSLGQTRLHRPIAVGLGEFGTSVFSLNARVLNNSSVFIPMVSAESQCEGVWSAPKGGLGVIRLFCRWPSGSLQMVTRQLLCSVSSMQSILHTGNQPSPSEAGHRGGRSGVRFVLCDLGRRQAWASGRSLGWHTRSREPDTGSLCKGKLP